MERWQLLKRDRHAERQQEREREREREHRNGDRLNGKEYVEKDSALTNINIEVKTTV